MAVPHYPGRGLPQVASLTAAVALLATGCRGPSPEERFAESVCSTTLPRAAEMLETFDDVQLTRAAPGPDARVTLWGLTLRGEEIARKYGAEIRALPAWDTDAGREAKSYLDQFSDRPLQRMAEAERGARKLPENVTLLQSIHGLDRLERTLVEAVFDMTIARSVIMQNIPELNEPFQKVDSCMQLDALGKD